MNSKILFIGKRIDNNELVKGLLMANFDNEYSIQVKNDFDGVEYFTTYKIDIVTVGQFIGLTDKNGVDIFSNGQLLRIKGDMGNDKEFSFDCIYKTNKFSFEGLSLSFVKLFDDSNDSVINSFPISQYPSFNNNVLDWCDDNKLIFKNTFGQNHISQMSWQEHHKTSNIEVIGNIYNNPELLK